MPRAFTCWSCLLDMSMSQERGCRERVAWSRASSSPSAAAAAVAAAAIAAAGGGGDSVHERTAPDRNAAARRSPSLTHGARLLACVLLLLQVAQLPAMWRGALAQGGSCAFKQNNGLQTSFKCDVYTDPTSCVEGGRWTDAITVQCPNLCT